MTRVTHRTPLAASASIALLVGASVAAEVPTARPFPWPVQADSRPLESAIAPPRGFERDPRPHGFSAFLRALPVRAGSPPVHLFDGSLKPNQGVHAAVIDIDTGRRDLQQCADAIIRLRAEYLHGQGRDDRICFSFTSGMSAPFSKWKAGYRPVLEAPAHWERRASPADGYATFRAYLDTVFTYAGTRSLARELVPVADSSHPLPGDVFIVAGSPGHAVIVLDAADSADGQRRFLIAQSFMPAQEIHVLKNPGSDQSPWYAPRADGGLDTPEWTFPPGSLRRFPTDP